MREWILIFSASAAGAGRHIGDQGFGQLVHWHALKHNPPRAGQCGKEQALAAEQDVFSAFYLGDVKVHLFLEHSDVSLIHIDGLPFLKVVLNGAAIELKEHQPRPCELLEDKACAAKNAGLDTLLKEN